MEHAEFLHIFEFLLSTLRPQFNKYDLLLHLTHKFLFVRRLRRLNSPMASTLACYTRAQCSAYSPRISTGPRLGDRNIPERQQLHSSSGPAPSVLPPARGMHGITSYALQLVGIVSCNQLSRRKKSHPPPERLLYAYIDTRSFLVSHQVARSTNPYVRMVSLSLGLGL